MPPLKLVHVATIDLSLRYLLLNQMLSASAAGFDVSAISSPGPEVAEVEWAGVRHIPVPMTRRITPWADIVALCRLFRVFRRERFDIVHTHTPKAGLLGQCAAWLARVPIRVHTTHGLYLPSGVRPWTRWFYVRLEKITVALSHMNLSQNPEDVSLAINEKISAPEKIVLLGNGINLQQFDPSQYSAEFRSRKRAELGLNDNHKIVGMVARFVAEKGYGELLEAARMIKQQMPEARFLLIGGLEGAKADGLNPEMISRVNLDDVVHYLGHRRDVAELYAIMDVLALPSHREGFPRAPMEAAAMGVPAVVTNIRGGRQTVDHGVTGYLVPLYDARALAEALLDILRDEKKRWTFGAAARAKALEVFDERIVCERILNVYALLDEHRRRNTMGRRPYTGHKNHFG